MAANNTEYAQWIEWPPINAQGKVTWATSGLTKEQAQVLQRIAWEVTTNDPDSGVKAAGK